MLFQGQHFLRNSCYSTVVVSQAKYIIGLIAYFPTGEFRQISAMTKLGHFGIIRKIRSKI